MVKMMNWENVRQTLISKKFIMFGPRDLEGIFGASAAAVTLFVHRNTKKGLLVRLKKSRRGSLYALADNLPDPFAIANRLYQPSYISLETAMSFHRIIPEVIYAITSVTTQTTRTFTAANFTFHYSRIKREAFTGYTPTHFRNTLIHMAEPEKAVADYLYLVSLHKRSFQYERIDLRQLNKRKLRRYIKLFGKKGMVDILEKINAYTG